MTKHKKIDMKIKAKEITDSNTLLGHIILDCFNKEAGESIKSLEGRNGETEYEINLSFNGVELDIREFCKNLQNSWSIAVNKSAKPQAQEIFEEMKQDFKSKNSTNFQLNKIKKQLEKVTNQLQNVSENVQKIK